MSIARLTCTLVVALTVATAPLHAQRLLPKRAIADEFGSGCESVTVARPGTSSRGSAEARRYVELGHDAEVTGDHRAARDAYAQAAQLDPGDARIAYYLARAHEELREARPAIREFCRYLALSPNADDTADVRARLQRLAPSGASPVTPAVTEHFRRGLTAYDTRDYAAAVEAFTAMIQRAPTVPEGYFNRAAAELALERGSQAAADLQRYLALRPNADDAAQTRLQLGLLRRPSWSPTAALLQGLIIPGLGQIYTARPVRGFVVLGLAGGALYWGLREERKAHTAHYTDAFGNPYTETYTTRERPNLTAGTAIAGVLTLATAIEAFRYASGARDAPPTRPAADHSRAAGTAHTAPWSTWTVVASPNSVGVRIPFPR